jgi:twitching motility protein PilT
MIMGAAAVPAPEAGKGEARRPGGGGKPRRRVGDWQAAPEPQARIEVPAGPAPQPSPPAPDNAMNPMPPASPPAPAAPAPRAEASAPAAPPPPSVHDAVDGFPLAEGDDRADVNLDDLPEALPAPAGPATSHGTMLGTAAVPGAAPAAAPQPPAPAPAADAAPQPPAAPGAAGGTVFGVGGVPVPAGLPQRLPSAPVQPPPAEARVPTPAPSRAADVRPAGAADRSAETYLGKALSMAVQHGASDLHAHSGAPLMIRVDGALHPLGNSPLSSEAAEKVIAEVMTDDQWDVLRKLGEVDFAYELRDLGRFRVNVYRQQRGLDVVFRIIPPQPPTLQQLGLPETLARLVDYRTGMVLCTGPAGCGKSTTLAALLNLLVQSRPDHVLTVEDPIEYVFPPGAALVNQRQVRDHTSSFSRALRAALREDPDIIAITELRDRETMSLAISAAETGHLVLGTLHTGNAAQTINRIVNAFPADEQEQIRAMLAESLRAVVSQRLVPTATGRGRAPAIEMLMVNTAVANIIRDDKTHQLPSVMQTGRAAGMRTLDDSLAELVKAGTIDKDQARRFAVKKERFA